MCIKQLHILHSGIYVHIHFLHMEIRKRTFLFQVQFMCELLQLIYFDNRMLNIQCLLFQLQVFEADLTV